MFAGNGSRCIAWLGLLIGEDGGLEASIATQNKTKYLGTKLIFNCKDWGFGPRWKFAKLKKAQTEFENHV